MNLNTDSPIVVRGLRKSYGDFEAVRGLDFDVRKGEVFGLLGPNGAGKTTTVEILEGIRSRSSGEVTVLGLDPAINTKEIKDRIGVSLQATNLPDKITVRESLALFSAFYTRHADADKLLQRLQLWDKRNSFYGTLSGGQKQRLALALAMINEPQLLFFDEPSTGLDPQVRLEIHSLIQELRADKRTILITTHYIEEAEKLCDRVAIIDQGKVIEIGTPQEIQAKTLGHSMIELNCASPLPAIDNPSVFHAERVQYSSDRTGLTVTCSRPACTIVELVKWIDQQGIDLVDINLKRPTLEDVFIELTGKKLRE